MREQAGKDPCPFLGSDTAPYLDFLWTSFCGLICETPQELRDQIPFLTAVAKQNKAVTDVWGGLGRMSCLLLLSLFLSTYLAQGAAGAGSGEGEQGAEWVVELAELWWGWGHLMAFLGQGPMAPRNGVGPGLWAGSGEPQAETLEPVSALRH